MEKRLPNYILVGLLLVSFALMLGASFHDSAIMDELAHIPAGYGYVSQLDYRLNPEHPPLIKALAAWPLLLIHPNYPTDNPAWQAELNGQWDMGTAFLYQSGNDANEILRIARIMPMVLTLILIFFVYYWARKRVGAWWALLPATLLAFSPIILAHGHYVTTDVGASLGIAVGIYFFVKYLESPSGKNMLWAGLAFGFAELLKFSTVLLIPFYVLLFIFWLWRTLYKSRAPAKVSSIFAWKEFWKLILIFVIGYMVIVYPIYFLFTTNYPIPREVSDTSTILGSFAGGPTPAGHLCNPMRCLANLDIWMAGHRLTQPFAQYALGVLMVFQRAAGGNTAYFLGEVNSAGSIIYFPIVYLLKEPLPNLLFVIFGLLLTLWALAFRRGSVWQSFKKYLDMRLYEFGALLFVVIYWAYSMHSTLNIGVRHLMPTIPLMYLLAIGPVKNWAEKVEWRKILVLVMVLWLAAESFSAYPHFLSYFNELGGGTWNGYRYVDDSNYDWGQDLLELKSFVDSHNIDKIAIDYFGGGNPQYYFGSKFIPWQSSKRNPANQGIHWLAVSVNTLEEATQRLAPGQPRSPEDSYSWLSASHPIPPGIGQVYTPDYRAGTSIFIYKF